MLSDATVEFVTRCAPRLGVHVADKPLPARQDLLELVDVITQNLPRLCTAVTIFHRDALLRMYVFPSDTDIPDLIHQLSYKRGNHFLYIGAEQRVIAAHIRLEGIVRIASKHTHIGP